MQYGKRNKKQEQDILKEQGLPEEQGAFAEQDTVEVTREIKKIIWRISPALKVAFFPLSFIWLEMLLRAFNSTISFFEPAAVRIMLFAAAYGLVVWLLLQCIPHTKVRRITGGILLFAITFIMGVESCCKYILKMYFNIEFMSQMTGQVAGDFAKTIVQAFVGNLPYIILSLVPFALFLLFAGAGRIRLGKNTVLLHDGILYGDKTRSPKWILGCIVLCLAFHAGASCWSLLGTNYDVYTYAYTAEASIPQFGELANLRLEAQYKIFGMPEPPVVDVQELMVQSDEPEEVVLQEVVYGYNQMDIDFTALAESTTNSTLKSLDEYFGSITPSQQNEYTGMFAGKNFIHITAESFSPYVISEEFTPTLYKLTHEGFVFTDFYQPGWHLSTTGGEFANMTGIIPTWYNGGVTCRLSGNDYMPFAFGTQFRKLGYTTTAYHNSEYSFYNRDLTHPNFGYDYYGIGNGLEIESASTFPQSDDEMFRATLPQAIENYTRTGQEFHIYYMTVSGHGGYGWGNAIAAKHKDEVLAAYPDVSQSVGAYLAANLDLEAGLTYMIEALEEAGIADDTVIVMTADHYPYMLSQGGTDYYTQLSGVQDTEQDISRYKNTFICWSGSIETPIVVDTPCSAIDIAPTVSNLFGLEYDSRLMSGRDVLATNYDPVQASTSMPLVICPVAGGYSWITAAGTYNANKREFTPNEGITVDDSYVQTVNNLVALKYTNAGTMIGVDYYSHVFGEQK